MEGAGALFALVVWVAVMVGGYYVGKEKGMPGVGLVLTALFSVIGLIAIAVIPAQKKVGPPG